MGSITNGMTLGYSETEEGEPTSVGELMSCTPGKRTAADISYKTLAGTTAVHRPGTKDNTAYNFSLLYDKANSAALEALVGEELYWTVTYSDGSTSKGLGFITEFGEGQIQPDGIMQSDGVIQKSGDWTFTPAA